MHIFFTAHLTDKPRELDIMLCLSYEKFMGVRIPGHLNQSKRTNTKRMGARQKKTSSIILFLLFIGLILKIPILGQIKVEYEDNLARALKIIDLLDSAARYKREKGTFQNKIAGFNEKEASVFMTYFISSRNSYLKSINLNFFSGREISGNIVMFVDRRKMPFINQGTEEVIIEFNAKIEIVQKKMRLRFSQITMDSKRLKKAEVNSLLGLIARSEGDEGPFISLWYLLPEGVRKIDTIDGRIFIYY